MAENRNTDRTTPEEQPTPKTLYLDLSAFVQVKELTTEERGQLLTTIFEYATTGRITEDLPRIVSIVFQRFKRDIDEDFARYARRCEINRRNAPKKNSRPLETTGNESKRLEANGNDSGDNNKYNNNNNSLYTESIIGDEPEKSVSPAPKKKETERHKYGEYRNVLLSDEEYDKLQTEFPADYEERIERLSSYIASTGKKYKSHLATIRNWAKKDTEQPIYSGQARQDGWDYINAVAEGRA